MSNGNEDNLSRLAKAVTDEIAVDWDSETRDHPELAGPLSGLRLVARIGEVFQAPLDEPEAATAPDAVWGHLQIREILGEGSYGTVYRAHDPRLRRDVALKLLRSDLAGGGLHARRFVAEARLMARVRHRNVLVIHGADEHDGRIGFWTDLLDGVTLEERLAGGEVFSAGEAALCGRELCRALGAVHGAGLVHGDVKAGNVMRDHDGRTVLMDFGAGSEVAGGDGPLSGTPLALAPELLNGGQPGAASDLYALGVLLYRLVTGRYPLRADSLADLRRGHAEGTRTPLLDLRPDLPDGFVAAVEKALAADPDQRFKSAGELEAALASTLVDEGDPTASRARTGRRSRAGWLIVIGVAALAAAGVLGVRVLAPDLPTGVSGVQVPLTASASFLRTGAEIPETLAEGALVRPGDTIGLSLQLAAAAHVYVVNEDRLGGLYVLFPLAETDLRNPLPRGRTLRLPGSWENTVLDWRVTEGRGEERFLVVAAREPIAWLESQLAGYEAPTRDRRYRPIEFESAEQQPERGVGAVSGTPAREPKRETALDALADRLVDEADDSSGIWIFQLMLYNLGR